MKETAITREHKLVIVGVIEKQFKDKFCAGFFEYDFLAGQSYLMETGASEEYDIDMPKQFEILRELASDCPSESIDISILENYYDQIFERVWDDLDYGISLTDDSDEREKIAFDIRRNAGSVYIRTTIAGIKEAKARYLEENYKVKLDKKYKLKLEFDDDFVNYHITCLPSGEVHSFHLHDGRPPQRIIKHVMGCKVGEYITKKELNQKLYPEEYKDGHWVIPKERSIKHHTFARDKELYYFFDMKGDKIAYLGDTAEGLTKEEVDNIGKK